jgi:hypothetical protein
MDSVQQPQQVNLPQEILTDVHKIFQRVILSHIAVVIILICSLCGAGYFAVRIHEKDLAHAEQLQQQFTQANAQASQAQTQLAQIIAQDTASRAQETDKQQQIELAMAQAAKAPLPVPVQQALAPSADAAEVVLGLKDAYVGVNPPMDPQVTSDGKIALTLPNAQQTIQEAAELEQSKYDYGQETQLFTLEQTKSTSLSKDLGVCQDTVTKDETALKAAGPAIVAYAKVANRTRLQRIFGSVGRNAERMLIFVAGAYLGHKL